MAVLFDPSLKKSMVYVSLYLKSIYYFNKINVTCTIHSQGTAVSRVAGVLGKQGLYAASKSGEVESLLVIATCNRILTNKNAFQLDLIINATCFFYILLFHRPLFYTTPCTDVWCYC